jgi:hypothetical protein
MTIENIPLSILRRACEQARRHCDHPAKIVPFICKFEPETVQRSNETLRYAQAKVDNFNAPRIAKQEPQYITSEELAEMKAELSESFSAQK